MKKAIISFDDVPKCSISIINKLNDLGIPTTLFVSLDFTFRENYLSLNDIKNLSERNEIACHTYFHDDILTHKYDKENWIQKAILNKSEFMRILNIETVSFAFPKGRHSLWYVNRLKNFYNVLRITKNGKNTIARIKNSEPFYSIPIYGKNESLVISKMDEYDDDILSLYSHDVQKNHTEFGTNEETVLRLVEYLGKKGFTFTTFRDIYRDCANN